MAAATPTDAGLLLSDPCEASHPFNEGGMRALKAVTIFSALLSVVGSVFIIGTWRLQGTRRSLGLHIICNLSIADLVASLVFIVDGLAPTGDLRVCTNGTTAPGLCQLNAAGAQLFGLAAVLWTGCIALGLHLGVLRRSKLALATPDKLIRQMHFAVWGSSCIALLFMGGLGTLGPTGQWCWVRNGSMWAGILFYYIPLVVVFVYSMSIYALTRRMLIDMHREAQTAASTPAPGGRAQSPVAAASTGALGGLTARLRAFLLVFGILNAFQLLNRLWDIANPNDPSYFLYFLQSLLGPLQGLGNAFAYGLTDSTRRVWSQAFPSLCGWLAPLERRPGGVDARSIELNMGGLESGREGDANVIVRAC